MLGNIQFFGQKTTQSGVGFPFHRRGTQLHLNRTFMLTDHFIGLRVRNDVKPKDCHNNCIRIELRSLDRFSSSCEKSNP